MKKIFITFIISSAALTTACTKQTLYLTPEITGYLYDSVTQKPLSKKEGAIIFQGFDGNKSPPVALGENGSFSIPPIKRYYYFIFPDVHVYGEIEPEIYVEYQAYKAIFFDYSKFYWNQVSEDKSGYEHYKKIDVGVIYLDPKNKAE